MTTQLLTEQERNILPSVLRTIVIHALTQRAKAATPADEGDKCLYRYWPDGASQPMKCFIGAIITDEFYDPVIEEESLQMQRVASIVQRSLGLHSPMSNQFVNILTRIQRIHDQHEPSEWRQELRREVHNFNDLLFVNFDISDIFKIEDSLRYTHE